MNKNIEHVFFLYSGNLTLILISCPAGKEGRKRVSMGGAQAVPQD